MGLRQTQRQPTRAQRNAGLLEMIRHAPGVGKVYRDSDGWWAECANGWRNGQDPVGVVHGAVEDTLPALADAVSMFRPCDCAECGGAR